MMQEASASLESFVTWVWTCSEPVCLSQCGKNWFVFESLKAGLSEVEEDTFFRYSVISRSSQ
jgi:hypothetical protein